MAVIDYILCRIFSGSLKLIYEFDTLYVLTRIANLKTVADLLMRRWKIRKEPHNPPIRSFDGEI